MSLAIRLAKLGWGKTSPNPMVGAVVVKDGKIVGRGYHKRAGGPHAEVIALEEAGEKSRGATLYVSLEPCVHFGKTPPCVEKIISSGIKRVVVPVVDPNPIVSGKGIKRLQENGIEVLLGVCAKPALTLNEVFFKWIRTGLPFVYLKLAISLDGKIAGSFGKRIKFTGLEADRVVHRLRSGVDAILVGRKTVEIDDPLLTTRLVKGKSPKRIILTGSGKIDISARIFKEGPQPVIVATNNPDIVSNAYDSWVFQGAYVKGDDLLRKAGKSEITSILIEGGAKTASWALSEKIVDKVLIFVAPKIVGDGVNIFDKVDEMDLKFPEIRRLGESVLISGYTPWADLYEG